MRVEITMVTLVCRTCGIPYSIGQTYYDNKSRHHYCPNGHSFYLPDISELTNKLGQSNARGLARLNSINAYKSHISRLKNKLKTIVNP